MICFCIRATGIKSLHRIFKASRFERLIKKPEYLLVATGFCCAIVIHESHNIFIMDSGTGEGRTIAEANGRGANRVGLINGVGETADAQSARQLPVVGRPNEDEESTAGNENDEETNLAGVRREKTRAMTAFNKARRALLDAIANRSTRSDIASFTAELDDRTTDAVKAMESLASLVKLQSNDFAAKKVSKEMEKFEEQYWSAQNRATEYCRLIRVYEEGASHGLA